MMTLCLKTKILESFMSKTKTTTKECRGRDETKTMEKGERAFEYDKTMFRC